MRFILYTEWNQLPESANILFAQSEQRSLFCSRIWLETLSTHALAEHQSLLLACVIESSRTLAILPLIKGAQGDLSSLSNNFTSLYSLLMTNSGQQDSILKCLAEGLARHIADDTSEKKTQSILFEPIDTNDDNIMRLHQLIEANGFKSQTYFRFYNWMHPIQDQSFDEYMAERPANLRNTIRRKKSKLGREHGYEIRLYKNDKKTPMLIDQVLKHYTEIYKTSWKTNEFFSDFTPALVNGLYQNNWLRLAILYANEQPIAAQIWFVVHGKANIYRLVHDENWKQYSPGSILTEYLMRYVIDTDKVAEIDFLTGNERYKQDWMTVRRERFGIRFAKQPKQKNSFGRFTESLRKLLFSN